MSKGGRYAKKKGHPSQKHGGGKSVALIVVAVVLVLVIAGLIGGIVYNIVMDKKNIQIQAETTAPMEFVTEAPETTALVTEETTEPTTVPTTLPYTESGMDIINILMVGQAARDGEESRIADTMILATINKNTKTLTLTSFLRDTYVDLPDYRDPNGTLHTCGWNRINVAYHLGWTWGGTAAAMEMTDQCLLENFGIEVDYNVEVDFNAVIRIVNLLDCVEVELTEAEAEYLNNDDKVWQTLQPGTNVLDGDSALAYARMRKAEGDADSDIKRTARQRYLIQAILNQVKNAGFSKLQELAYEVLPYITTDMTNEEINTCIWEILPLLPELKVETGTCPVEKTYWGEVIDLFGTQSSVLKFDAGQNKKLMAAITEGTTD
ncbi:MAG: LCP family protein [Faecousia sp.]